MKMKLQSVLEEYVTVSLDETSMMIGAAPTPVCKIRIDDSTDGEHVGLIASLTEHEARALGAAMTRWADQQDAVRIRDVQHSRQVEAFLDGQQRYEAFAMKEGCSPQPQEDVTPMAGQNSDGCCGDGGAVVELDGPMAGQNGTGPTGQA